MKNAQTGWWQRTFPPFSPREGEVVLVQLLRAVAASWVVLHHFTAVPAYMGDGWFYRMAWYGTSGVYLFFVISGYVISKSAEQRIGKPLRFGLDRALRILPPYYVTFAVALVVTVVSVKLTGKSFAELSHGIGPRDYLGNLLLVSNLFPKPLYLVDIFWTLCYEMQFYAVVALALWLASRGFKAVMTGLAVTVFAASMVVENAYLFNVAFFSLGYFVYRAHKDNVRWVDALALAAAVAFIVKGALEQNGAHHITGGVTAVVILAGGRMDHLFRHQIWKPVWWTGRVSYSLYLLHNVLGIRVISTAERFGWLTTNRLAVLAVLTWLAMILFCLAWYPVVEVALPKWLKQRFFNRV